MHGDDEQHYDVDYRSSKQWKRPSHTSKDYKDSREWKKSRDWKKYGDEYEPKYGKAYSMHQKDRIVKEPKVTAAGSSEHWKKSDYKPSRNWKKNDKPKGQKDRVPKHHTKKPSQKPHKKTDYPTFILTAAHPTTTTAHPATKYPTPSPAQPTTATAHPTTTTASAHVYPSMKPVYGPKHDEPADYEPK